MVDIFINFRTTFMHSSSGEEITTSKEIACNYIQGRFWIDFAAVLPVDAMANVSGQIITLGVVHFRDYGQSTGKTNLWAILNTLKLTRVLRLGRIITYMNESDDIKLSLRLMKMCFFLGIYIHFSACIWYMCCNFEK